MRTRIPVRKCPARPWYAGGRCTGAVAGPDTGVPRRREDGLISPCDQSRGMGLFRRGRPDVEALLRAGDVRGLIERLDGPDGPDERLRAAAALGQLGEPAVGPLLSSLEDLPRARGYAALALGTIGDSRAVRPMIGLLADPVAEVRFLAALALGRMGDAAAVESLCAALADPARDVREAAAWALGALGDSRAANPLAALRDDPDAGVRDRATEALEKLGAHDGGTGADPDARPSGPERRET